jgi:uncharacterized lipoprotein YddW (UPF0748 family)
VAGEIAELYEVDGIHLDYIRYPGRDYCHDAVSEARFSEALALDPGLSRADWQRSQVEATVAKVRTSIGPDTTLSVAVWGIHTNVWGWSSVSQGYHDYYQDPRPWAASGTVDAVVPMIYWDIKDPYAARLDFRAILDEHVAAMPTARVYAGIHGDYESFLEIDAEIAHARETGAAGYVIFAYPYLVTRDTFDEFASGPNAEPASPP